MHMLCPLLFWHFIAIVFNFVTQLRPSRSKFVYVRANVALLVNSVITCKHMAAVTLCSIHFGGAQFTSSASGEQSRIACKWSNSSGRTLFASFECNNILRAVPLAPFQKLAEGFCDALVAVANNVRCQWDCDAGSVARVWGYSVRHQPGLCFLGSRSRPIPGLDAFHICHELHCDQLDVVVRIWTANSIHGAFMSHPLYEQQCERISENITVSRAVWVNQRGYQCEQSSVGESVFPSHLSVCFASQHFRCISLIHSHLFVSLL